MAAETKVVNVAPESELGRFLEEIGGAPVILDKDGERYVLAREDAHDIWVDYDPEKVRQALRQGTGILAGVDRESLLSEIHAAREQNSPGRPDR
ncbi:MAG: hypothetical protein OXE05_09905 [Chloroflexi bacterium]|nr:hypothetical protein [Chloroflexota bacterium]